MNISPNRRALMDIPDPLDPDPFGNSSGTMIKNSGKNSVDKFISEQKVKELA